jgi:hypothetical protein
VRNASLGDWDTSTIVNPTSMCEDLFDRGEIAYILGDYNLVEDHFQECKASLNDDLDHLFNPSIDQPTLGLSLALTSFRSPNSDKATRAERPYRDIVPDNYPHNLNNDARHFSPVKSDTSFSWPITASSPSTS